MDLKSDTCSELYGFMCLKKKDLMDVIYSKHVRLILLFIDGNNLLIFEIQFYSYYLYILQNIIHLISVMVY